jgi:hypothetical protein
MVFSEVLTEAEISNPRDIDTRASAAIASISSTRGSECRNAPCAPDETNQDQHGGLHPADEPKHGQLRPEVRSGRQPGCPFPAANSPFLDQFADRVESPGEANADDQDQQERFRVRVGWGEAGVSATASYTMQEAMADFLDHGMEGKSPRTVANYRSIAALGERDEAAVRQRRATII